MLSQKARPLYRIVNEEEEAEIMKSSKKETKKKHNKFYFKNLF